MFESCIKKQSLLKEQFATCSDQQQKYQKIIELGKALPPLAKEHKITENIVQGCQSTVYLHTFTKNGAVYYEAASDALITSGLAAMLIAVYSGETPETILKCPPTFLDELEIGTSLTPNRANGLHSMHLRMKQEALKLLI